MISPILFNGTVQRTQDVTSLKQNEDMKPQMDHAVIVSEQHNKDVKKYEQVLSKENVGRENNKHDAKEKGKGMYFGQSRGRKREDKEADGKVRVKTRSSFDMKA